MKRLIWIFIGLCTLILITFAIFGDSFETWFSTDASIEMFEEHRHLAGPIGAGLLLSDLLLPIPTTVIIGAMGAVLGIAEGAAWGWLGLTLAGVAGYGLARLGGEKWGSRLTPHDQQESLRNWFESWGGLAVVLSRMLPILPEAISVTAGLAGMRFLPFCLSVALGSLPPALAFAWMGHTARTDPGPALWITVALMGLAWIGYLLIRRKHPPSGS